MFSLAGARTKADKAPAAARGGWRGRPRRLKRPRFPSSGDSAASASASASASGVPLVRAALNSPYQSGTFRKSVHPVLLPGVESGLCLRPLSPPCLPFGPPRPAQTDKAPYEWPRTKRERAGKGFSFPPHARARKSGAVFWVKLAHKARHDEAKEAFSHRGDFSGVLLHVDIPQSVVWKMTKCHLKWMGVFFSAGKNGLLAHSRSLSVSPRWFSAPRGAV